MSGVEKLSAGIYLAGCVAVLGYLINLALRLTRLRRMIDELEEMSASPSGERPAAREPAPYTGQSSNRACG
jgi:hypothetical protein